jgi:hypothetical protein
MAKAKRVFKAKFAAVQEAAMMVATCVGALFVLEVEPFSSWRQE